MSERAKQQGCLIIIDPSAPAAIEYDTFTCSHCNSIAVIDRQKPETLGGFCRMCMKSICNGCVDAVTKGPTGCVPFEKKMEEMERRERLRREIASG